MKIVKWFLLGLAVVVLAIGVTAGILFYYAGKTGSGTIENWIAGQLQAIANSYLNPRLSFSDLDYEYPGTVRVKALRLTADDPANPGKSIDILGASNAEIVLAEIPSIGKPIVIERIILKDPLFQAVAVAPESNEFVGFSNLLRATGNEKPKPSPDASSPAPKLSEVFQMRLVELQNGRIVYDPRLADTPPMELDQIQTRLDIEPSNDGWYKLATTLSRKPVFDMSIDGRLNLDSFSADQLDVKLAGQVGDEEARYLPPQLQRVLKQYEVQGDLAVNVTGSAPLTDPAHGALDADVQLSKANVSLDEYRVPVQNLHLQASLADQIVQVSELQLKALQGNASGIAFVALNPTLDTDLKLRVEGMKIQDTLRKGAELDTARYGGTLNAEVQTSVPLANVITAATVSPAAPASQTPASTPDLPENWGSARIQVTDARLVHLPVISDLADSIGKPAAALTGAGSRTSRPTDRADIAMSFSHNHIEFNQIDIRGSWFAVRGDGNMSLDQKLNLRFNGGPLEKVETMLGDEVGGAVSAMTDSVMAYRITGSVQDPRVTTDVADGALGESATLAKDTAGAVKDTASEAGDVAKEAEDAAKEAGTAAKEGASAIGEGAKEVGRGVKDLFGF